jgi:hypothetical protein
MTDMDEALRWQQIVRLAAKRMDTLRLSDEVDEYFCEEYREALLAAGATDSDIDNVAAFVMTLVLQNTAPDSDERRQSLEAIASHLACRDTIIGIGQGDAWASVRFPTREMIQ